MEQKLEILDIDYDNAMDLIKKLLYKTKNEKIILHNISYYLGKSSVYIEDWNIQERRSKIIELYETEYKNSQYCKEAIYEKIVHTMEKLIASDELPSMSITKRVVRHVLESS